MDNYREKYESKFITVDEALHLIKSGDTIAAACGATGPWTTLRRLHEVSEWAEDIHVLSAMAFEEYPFICDEKYRDVFTCDCVFSSAAERISYSKGLASYFPAHLHSSASYWLETHQLNVFIGVATPMEEDGKLYLSCSLMCERDCLEQADLVILEINPTHPVVYGETEISIDDVDYLIAVDTHIGCAPYVEPLPIHKTIGGFIAELINDGDTIQLGIGGIPDAAADCLMDKHDLGIHTELITGRMANLIEAGVVNGSKKSFMPGKVIGTFAVGDQHLYDVIDHNRSVELYRASFTTNPIVIAKNDNMVSVNTAFCSDLTGQIASESIGFRQYSGSGGQADTAIGAGLAKNGRRIIAFKSTTETKKGIISNIKLCHDPGTVVTLSRNDVDYVITEYGIASLKGKSIRERVKSLCSIAHPDFRTELLKEGLRAHNLD